MNCLSRNRIEYLQLDRGFTLIEILICLAIIAIAFVAILKSTILVQEALISTKKQNRASMLGAQKMAEIAKAGPENIKQWNGRFEDDPNFKWRVQVTSTSKDRLKRINLTILDSNKQKIQSFERVIFKPPAQ